VLHSTGSYCISKRFPAQNQRLTIRPKIYWKTLTLKIIGDVSSVPKHCAIKVDLGRKIQVSSTAYRAVGNFTLLSLNKKFWKELICLLSLHYLTLLYEWQQKCTVDGRFEYGSLHGRTTANSCISGSRNVIIIFLHFIHLWRKLNSLQRYDIAQNYRILHRVVQRLSQHNLKISHHRHI
jgi:hypothetical protein